MPNLISKLQYKTCEKGEYYDEQPRSLEETIALIKRYPWYREQYADIELTGPSITIKDNQDNYLKIGIYYGGRLTLYYLFNNVLYTRFNLGYEEVIPAVEQFFGNDLTLEGFEKTLYNVGKKNHFTTKQFIYRTTIGKILLRLFFLIFLLIFPLFVTLATAFSLELRPFFVAACFTLPLGYLFYGYFSPLYKNRKQFLQISRGNNSFIFSDENGVANEFNKADITEIIHYISNNSRNAVELELFDIRFNNGTSIRFPNTLISASKLNEKFAGYWKLKPLIKKGNIFRLLHNSSAN